MPTIHDVARHAGVSPDTVARIAGRMHHVSPEVLERVCRAMAELGYQPMRSVPDPRQRPATQTIGLITPDNANPFFAQVARGAEEASFDRGYSVLLGNANGDLARELVYLQVMADKNVDGIIFAACSLSSEHLSQETMGTLPFVLIDRDLPGVVADRVLADHRKGGKIATEYLLGLGHHRIACIAGPGGIATSAQRLAGYVDALATAGVPVDSDLIVPGVFDFASGHEATRQLLRVPNPPTAIFACNDLMAIGAINAAKQAGLAVPTDLSIVGFDDTLLAAYTSPPLTTVHHPAYTLGKIAAEILISRIADPQLEYHRQMLPVELVLRSSCGTPRADQA